MTDVDRRSLCQAAFNRMALGDSTVFLAMLAKTCRWTVAGTSSWSRTYEPKRAIIDELLRPLRAELEGNVRVVPLRVIADGDIVVVQARGDNVTKRGDRYDNTYCFVLRFEADGIVEIVEHADTALIDRVLGKLPERPA
jgi:ketosteroid isomerase-like protein